MNVTSGKPQQLQEGAKTKGPSHKKGGVEVRQEDTGEAVAEIEGGERVFSTEDTEIMEQMAGQIMELSSAEDKEGADQVATQLGYQVVQMIMKQEQLQNQGVSQPTSDDIYAQAANSFV